MTATILDGRTMAQELRADIAKETAQFVAETGVTPCLAAILVGDDPGSQVYVRNKERACEKAGMAGRVFRFDETTDEELFALIDKLNNDESVHGILVQTPLPDGMNQEAVLEAIHPLKDVDAFHPDNVGRIVQNRPRFLPCTPYGIQEMLVRNKIETAGANVVVVGRSDLVGKPIAIMLMQKGPKANATVTVAHSRTKDLAALCRTADILIVAIGQAKFVTADMVKPGATVIDVGINRTADGLVGDVDYEPLLEVAGAITPVPGGVGQLTVTMLLKNTLQAARLQVG
ncbi:MAG: bifunctional 5,10-methylenetetrahydrofolate dehydrogenase/5,10-methenyltetrahydrofolate cyclohydrolase [Planctomycetia bacterium]